MILSKLPKELSQKIFLMLDGSSLHCARQVCKAWDRFVIQQVWNTRVGRKSLQARLKYNWMHEEPKKSMELFSFKDLAVKASLLGMSDQYIAVKV